MKTNTDYSFKHEGQLLEKELQAMIKKIKADTKDLKKRFKAYTRRVDRFYDKNYNLHPELANQVAKYCGKIDDIIHFEASNLFEDWL
jgi:hypothetical protein